MTPTPKTARHIHIPVEHARHVRMRLKQITFGDCVSMSDNSFSALAEAIKLLDTAFDQLESKNG